MYYATLNRSNYLIKKSYILYPVIIEAKPKMICSIEIFIKWI